jgi:hypothetical protein
VVSYLKGIRKDVFYYLKEVVRKRPSALSRLRLLACVPFVRGAAQASLFLASGDFLTASLFYGYVFL